jgi:hypothetical protein
MFLLDQKAEDIISKITFAEKTISEVKSPDDVLGSYIEPLVSWLSTLKGRVEQAKADFAEFVHSASFGQEGILQNRTQRRLLAAILRDFEDIEKRVYIGVDTFLPLIFVWNSQKNRVETKVCHELLMHFVNDVLQLSSMSGPIMTIVGESYACLPIEWAHIRKHVIFGAYSEMQNLRKCVLLAHEIGHVFYYQNNREISSSIIPRVIRKLCENRPANFDQNNFESIIYIWAQHWIPELVSDCFAVKTLGPAFVYQFMLAALNSQPDQIESAHPPPNLRVNFMLDILETLNLPDINTNAYRRLWQSYAGTVSTPTSVFILDEDVVASALSGIDSILTEKPIEDKWTDILEAKKMVCAGAIPNQDLVSTISALAIEESRGDLAPLHNELLKRYASNSNVS